MMADQEVLSHLWIMRKKMSVPQPISSWTGFQMSVKNGAIVVTTAIGIGYLYCTDSSASDISTVNKVLYQCIKIKKSLNLCFSYLCLWLRYICQICWDKMEKSRSHQVLCFHARHIPYTNDAFWNHW